MSRLDELIRNLCPEGVEYKTLGEIATDASNLPLRRRKQSREKADDYC